MSEQRDERVDNEGPRPTPVCPVGKPDAAYSCRFCHVSLHHPGDCYCSAYRGVTFYAPLCNFCADALDVLMDDTTVGNVHKILVREANMAGRPSGD